MENRRSGKCPPNMLLKGFGKFPCRYSTLADCELLTLQILVIARLLSCARCTGLFLRLHEIIFKSRKVRQPSLLTKKGLAISPAPCYFVFQSGSPQRAAAAMAGVPTFTLICFGFASSRFGMLSISTPF